MRPKFLAVLTAASLALVGCSSESETSETQALETGSDSAVSTDEGAEMVQDPATGETITIEEFDQKYLIELAPTPTLEPSAAFVESIESEIGEHMGSFESALPGYKMTGEYWLELGEEKCQLQESGDLSIRSGTDNAIEGELEFLVMRSAVMHLCPDA